MITTDSPRWLDLDYELSSIPMTQGERVARMFEVTERDRSRALSALVEYTKSSEPSAPNYLLQILEARGVPSVRLNSARENLEVLAENAFETVDAINQQSAVIVACFTRLSLQMASFQHQLAEIHATLQQPLQTAVIELYSEARAALIRGTKASGRDRDEEFSDALRLLQNVLENPIGSRNFMAWFDLGWIQWKHARDFKAAEESFYQASRLSKGKQDEVHLTALRHIAYMQYFQENFPAAFETQEKALALTSGNLDSQHDVMYDLARYAAKLGKTEKAIALLDQCIDLRPSTIITMFSEVDFK